MNTTPERQLLTDGHVVFRQGQPASVLYLLVQGEVDLVKNTGNKIVPTGTCKAGDFMGLNAILSEGNYSVTAKVKDVATVIPIERDQIHSQLSKLDKLTLNIVYSAVNRFNNLLDENIQT